MKFVKITLVVILGLILIVWIAGALGGETDYRVEVKANSPVEIAWQVFMDDSLMSDWLTGLKSVEHLEGEPQTTGSKFKLIFEEQGNRYEMIETVTAIETEKRFAFDGDSDIMSSHSEITFNQVGDSTIISDQSYFQAKGFVLKAILPLMNEAMAERSKAMYVKLAALMEEAAIVAEKDSTALKD